MKLLPILTTVTVLMHAQVHAAETAPPAVEPPRTSAVQLLEGPIDTVSRPLLLPDSPLPEGGLLITAEADASGGSGAAQVHDCGGRVVEVAADFAVVALTGHCQHLRVRGHHNVVQVQAVHAIDVIGDRNAVTWGGVPDDATRRLKPSVSERGTGNLVGPGTVVLPAPAASP